MSDSPLSYLQNALQQGTLPHALLFIGSGGEEEAKSLATELLKTDLRRIEAGQHPDFHPFRPEGKSGQHSIESIRNLIDRVYRGAFEAERKVLLIYHAERMQPAAANALLKTLEEPLPDTTLILLAEDPRQMLPTILSRCTRLLFQETPSFQPIDFLNLPQEIAAIEAIEDPILQSRRVDEFLSSLMMWARDAQAKKLGLSEEKLFFPKAPLWEKPISLEKLEGVLQKARLGYQRNMKLSACLDVSYW